MTDNQLIVLCKDCKHQKNRDCYRAIRVGQVDVVTGKRSRAIYPYCSNERHGSYDGACGIDGKHFEPKKKWWKLW